MKVAIRDITGPELSLRIDNASWLPEDTVASGPVTASVDICRAADGGADIRGSLLATTVSVCDRCCTPVDLTVDGTFVYHCVVGADDRAGGSETECCEADCLLLYLQEPLIDVTAILREQYYLGLPQRTLCRPDCRGLCQQCGCDLNTDGCMCGRQDNPGPFAVLEKLRKKS